MDQVTWPDGYEINFIYNASFDLIAIEDNRNQRAEFSWSQDLVSSIEIDTDYDGTTFVPVLEIDYTYSLPGPNSSWSGIRELEQATTTQIATGEILSDHSYWYSDNGAGRGLVSTLDGTTGAAPGTNQSNIPYGNYSYLFGIATSTEHAGGVERFERTSPGGNPTITNPLGKVTEYFYETVAGQPRVSQINGQATASCLGTAKSFDYTPNAGAPEGYVYEQIERNGSKTTFARDSRGLILTQTEDADGTFPRVTTYTWHSTLRLPLTRTTSQMEETFVYDGDGQLTSYTQRDVLFGSPSVNATRTWAYTFSTLASGLKVMTSMDGPGLVANGTTDVTTFTHNADGTMASSTDPNGLTTTYANYDGFGNPTRIVQPDGVAWALTFDAEGQLTQVIENVDRNSANTSTFAYDLVGQMTSYTNGSNKTWTFAYDKARRMVQTVNPDGETIDYTYDLAGNIAKTEYSQANGQITFFQDFAFDELSRLKDILGAEGQTAAFTYDEEDNLATAVDAISLMTSHSYDALNRMTQTVDRASGTTLMEHDDAGQMTRYTDPRGIDTDMTYNGFGDVVQELSADRGTMTYSYNNRGLVSSMTDGRGIVSNYNYDDGGRLTARTFPSAPAENVSFYYDFGNGDNEGEGKIGFIDDESGHTYFRYERGGHLVQENPTIEYTYYRVSYSVDNYGRVYEMKTPGKLEVKYAYDNQDRVRYIRVERKVRDPITNQFPPAVTVLNQVKYEPFGPLKSMNYAGGGAHTRSYDNSYRLTGLTDLVYGATLRDVAHSWTSRDNLSIASDAVNGLNTETYQYSAREFLSQATGPYDQIGFTYDAVGNRTSRAVTDISTVTDTYTYPLTSNRLQSVALGADGTRSLTYDAAGNVTYDNRNGPGYGYAYNAAGRMESMSINGVVQAEYTYNARGQQVIRNLTQAGYRIHVIHDKDGNRLAEYQIDNTTGVSTLLQEYIWHDGVPVAVVDGQTDEVFLVRTDHIGRPVFATDMSGVKVWEATYLPFGGVHVSTGANMELRFPGQWFQAESGLHQNWMREYDPTTGRYIQADPLGLVDGASVYSYALQNPGRYVDPRGENSFSTITQPRVPEGPRVGGGGNGSGFGGGGAAIAATIGNILRGARALPQSIAKEGEVCKSCPPCKPYPVGDVGFIGPETHLRGRDAGTAHYHIYEVQQIPSTCKCFWRETTKRITGNHHSLVPMGHNLNGLGRPPAYP